MKRKASGRESLRCANASCTFAVHSRLEFGGYCCRKCHAADGSGARPAHGAMCEMVTARAGAPRAAPDSPLNPLSKARKTQQVAAAAADERPQAEAATTGPTVAEVHGPGGALIVAVVCENEKDSPFPNAQNYLQEVVEVSYEQLEIVQGDLGRMQGWPARLAEDLRRLGPGLHFTVAKVKAGKWKGLQAVGLGSNIKKIKRATALALALGAFDKSADPADYSCCHALAGIEITRQRSLSSQREALGQAQPEREQRPEVPAQPDFFARPQAKRRPQSSRAALLGAADSTAQSGGVGGGRPPGTSLALLPGRSLSSGREAEEELEPETQQERRIAERERNLHEQVPEPAAVFARPRPKKRPQSSAAVVEIVDEDDGSTAQRRSVESDGPRAEATPDPSIPAHEDLWRRLRQLTSSTRTAQDEHIDSSGDAAGSCDIMNDEEPPCDQAESWQGEDCASEDEEAADASALGAYVRSPSRSPARGEEDCASEEAAAAAGLGAYLQALETSADRAASDAETATPDAAFAEEEEEEGGRDADAPCGAYVAQLEEPSVAPIHRAPRRCRNFRSSGRSARTEEVKEEDAEQTVAQHGSASHSSPVRIPEVKEEEEAAQAVFENEPASSSGSVHDDFVDVVARETSETAPEEAQPATSIFEALASLAGQLVPPPPPPAQESLAAGPVPVQAPLPPPPPPLPAPQGPLVVGPAPAQALRGRVVPPPTLPVQNDSGDGDEVVIVKVDDVFYYQDSIKDRFRDERAPGFLHLIDGLSNEHYDPLVEDFLMLDGVRIQKTGKLYSLNNRRLFCLKRHQERVSEPVMVRLRIVATVADEARLRTMVQNFSTTNGGQSIFVRGSY
eukprot:TRINITY_DN5481_c0_g1_i2.p1 TRINITY_DN5481_c0_g1~~TRINITY_DN5481_c0_g1_i2.p1  ORF type:complete len:850 (-),score=209.50 TRINITY_DN5481_c0_g1_i2:43-2592(-)